MHLQNTLTKRNFNAGSGISKRKFTQKRRISRSYCSWMSSSIQNQLREDFSDYEELDLMMAAELNGTILYLWSTKLPSVELLQNKKGEKILHRAEDWRMFQRKTSGSCSRRDTCSFFTHACHGTVKTTWNEVEIRHKISPGASILFSTESERYRLTKKLEQTTVLWLKLKILPKGGQDENNRHVWGQCT